MAVNESQPLYCGSGMDNFHTSYKNLHGYISLIVCILGTIANTLNIIVLSRREMRSPTNTILTGLAVADLIVMLEYIPYTIHDYILFERLPREQQLSYSWACFIKFHSIFAQVLHTISIWLTVTLAVWRYIAVGYPQKNRQWCGMRTTIITITSAYVVCVLVVSPSLYLVTSIAEFLDMLDANGKTVKSIALSQYIIDYDKGLNNNSASLDIAAAVTGSDNIGQTSWPNASNTTTEMLLSMANSSNTFTLTASTTASPTTTVAAVLRNSLQQSVVVRNVTVYRLYHSDLALRNITLRNATFLIYSVLIKLIPCIALTILSIRLIMALLEAKRRRKMLTSNAANGMKPMASGKVVEPTKPRKNSKTLEKEKQTDRTTRMLLAVLLLFLITEFPQGIMGLLNTILGNAFLMQCYLRLSDLMDILALINSSINFILYCSMSRQFRTTFTLLFRPKFLDKWLPVAQDDEVRGGTNNVRGSDGFAARNPARGGQGKNGVQHDVKIRQPLSVDNMAYDKQRNRRTTGNVLVEDNEDAGICQLDCKFSNKMKKNSDFIDECQTQFKDNYSNDSNCSNATEKPLNTTTACIDILNDENRDKNRNIQWFRSSSLTALSPLFSCLLCNIKRRHSFKCEHQQQHQKIINPCVNTRHQDIVGNSGFVSTIVVIRQDSSLDHHVYAAHSCNENCLSAASVTAGLPLSSSATTAASSCLLL